MSKPKILVVDDERELLTSIQRILTREKMEVITATCAEEALLALQQSLAPDLVISDLMMPGIGGLELLKMMQAKMPEVPVILITAHATLETAIEAIRAGAHVVRIGSALFEGLDQRTPLANSPDKGANPR